MTNSSNIDIETLARRIVELGGNAGVTQRCVPLASGGLNPDWRVNYEFGLVLGVDEFSQEQFYHLQKGYLHNRALHGYGVVSGLEVFPERTLDDDISINVSTGVGVDQCGRTFIIRSDQCAYLRAWLERNRQSLSMEDGDLTLYVVGTYDECKDALVAIAGQPCASSEQSLAPSRIRDSFNITLSQQPPAMPAWNTIRRLASLMTHVRIVDGLPEAESDEAAITERVRVIDDPAALAALDQQGYWRLPAQDINETLDRIFMVWVTEVRPRLTPTVIDGCGTSDPVETGILLGRLTLRIDNANTPIQFTFSEAPPETPAISYDERPYLMQTQLIQELLFLGASGASRLFGSVFVRAEETLMVWVHHPETLVLANPDANAEGALEVYVDDRRVGASIISGTGTPARNVFDVQVAEPIAAAARVEVRFLLGGWRVAEEELPPAPLLASIDQLDFEYVGREGDTIHLYAFAERLPEVRDFVLPSRRLGEDVPLIRLWFPFDTPLNLDEVTEEGQALIVVDTATGERLPFRIEATDDRHVWLLRADIPDGRGRAAAVSRLNEALNNARVTLDFDASMINIAGRAAEEEQRTLLAAMADGQYSYTGFDGRSTITVPFVPEQVQAPAQGGLTEADVIRIIQQNRQPIPPVVPLANLQFMSTNFDNVATFELWFHLDLEWTNYRARVEDDFSMLVLAEVMDDGQPRIARLNFERRRVEERPNVFEIQVFTDGPPERLQYLRFVFPVQERLSIESDAGGFGSLEEFMKNTGVRLDNYYDMEGLTSTPAVVLYGRALTRREG